MSAKPDHPADPHHTHRLRCDRCGTTRVATVNDLIGFARSGWPWCCGEVMALVHEDGSAAAPVADHPPAEPA